MRRDVAALRRAAAPSTHKTPSIQRWLIRHLRFTVHFTPTWIANWNEDPTPYVWHKTADEILNSLASYCQRISDRSLVALNPLRGQLWLRHVPKTALVGG